MPRFSGIQHLRTSPETKFWGRSSDAVQAYVREGAEHGKRRALPSPEFSLNARIPTLPNCVQEGDFNLASTALQNCTTYCSGGVLKASLAQHLKTARPLSKRELVVHSISEITCITHQVCCDEEYHSPIKKRFWLDRNPLHLHRSAEHGVRDDQSIPLGQRNKQVTAPGRTRT